MKDSCHDEFVEHRCWQFYYSKGCAVCNTLACGRKYPCTFQEFLDGDYKQQITPSQIQLVNRVNE